MTVPDLGSERPHGQASETRQMVERARTETRDTSSQFGSRGFLLGLILIAVAILAFAVLR